MVLRPKLEQISSVKVEPASKHTFYSPLIVVNIAKIASNRVLFVSLPKFSSLEANYMLWPPPVISMR